MATTHECSTERRQGAAGGEGRERTLVEVDLGLKLVRAWHAAAVLVSLVLVWLVVAGPNGALPTAPGAVLVALGIGFVAGHAAAFVGLAQRARWARSVSFAASYLVFVVFATAYAHRIGVFRGLNSFAGGFNTGILAIPVVAVGAWWVLVARRLARRRPDAPFVGSLRIAGLVVLAAGLVLFGWRVDVPGGVAQAVRLTVTDVLTLAAAVVAILSGAAARFVFTTRVADHLGIDRRQNEALTGLLFLSPNILGFLAFFAGPLLFSLYISFNTYELGRPATWIWFDNYRRAFSDPLFRTSLRNILVFLVLAVPLSVLPALGLSTLLNSRLKGVRFFRAVYFVPSVAGVIGITIIWSQLFAATVGWINYVLTNLNSWFDWLPFVDERTTPVQMNWLSNTNTALVAIVVVFAWMTFGFNTVLYLAGHQGIPQDLYEAAELDGASAWKRFTRITVPQLRNTTFYVVATTSILAMQQFDIVFVSTNPPGAPNNTTLTPVLHLYNEGFQRFRQGYASSIAWVLFVLIFGLTVVQFRRQRAGAEV